MSNLTPVNESNHLELLSLINPLIDFMQKNEYSFFLVAGKEGTATRHLLGQLDDVSGMIQGMMENHPQVESLIKYTAEDYEANLELKKQPIPKFPKGGIFHK